MDENAAKALPDEYLRLGGRRQLVVDDNNLTTGAWEKHTPEAEAFWSENINLLSDARTREVLSILPSINAIRSGQASLHAIQNKSRPRANVQHPARRHSDRRRKNPCVTVR